MTQKGATMQKINRPALRHAGRSLTGWLLTLITAIYVVAATIAGSPLATVLIYTAVYVTAVGTAFYFRYSDHVRAAREADRDARYRAARAEQQAVMARYDAERAAARAEFDAEIRSGARCPEWCDSCEAERREADDETARFLRERAARHEHAEQLRQEKRDALAELNARLHPGYLSPEELLDDESLAHLRTT